MKKARLTLKQAESDPVCQALYQSVLSNLEKGYCTYDEVLTETRFQWLAAVAPWDIVRRMIHHAHKVITLVPISREYVVYTEDPQYEIDGSGDKREATPERY